MLYDVAVGGLKQRHPNTVQGVKGAERKWSRLAVEEMRTIVEWYLQAYGLLLTLVSLCGIGAALFKAAHGNII